jgi:pyruvate carboxylase
VAVGADPAEFEQHPERFDIPDSVIGFMAGELGDLPGGWPEPFRTKVLAGRTVDISIRPISEESKAQLLGSDSLVRRNLLNRLLFPQPTKEFDKLRNLYGRLDTVNTIDYLYGLDTEIDHVVELKKGLQLFVGLEAIGEVDPKGFRTVMAKLNGQLRPVTVRDYSVQVASSAAEKADPKNPGHTAAPFTGVVTPKVAVGEIVELGAPIAIIEAMKMEASITAPIAGRVSRLGVVGPQPVEGGDLIVVIEA